jgi:hypothetical protein
VGDEIGFDAPGLLYKLGETAKELVIRKRFESSFVGHTLL